MKSIITVLFCLCVPLMGADKKKPLTFACLLALLLLPTPNAQADSQARAETILLELRSHPVNANEARTARAIERLRELGELGPDAAPALPFLVSDEFYKSVAQKNPALKRAAIKTLIRIGEPAVSAVVDLLTPKPQPKNVNTNSAKSDKKQAAKAASRAKQKKAALEAKVREILLAMSRGGLSKTVVAKLEEGMVGKRRELVYGKRGFNRVAYLDLLALMGADAGPVLKREAVREVNSIRQIATLIGPEIGDAIDAIIPERYNESSWENKRYWLHYNSGLWPLAHAKPAPKHIPAFLDLIRNDKLQRQYHFRSMRLTGMLLSGMGDDAAEPLASLLRDPNTQSRWAAATILAMIGPDMKAAVPALEKVHADKNENVGVRVAAARAIAAIRSSNPFDLYKKIPDVESRIVASSREMRLRSQSHELWREHFTNSSNQTMARQLALYNLTLEWERPLYELAVGENVKAHNQWLREVAAETLSTLPPVLPGLTGTVLNTDAHPFLLLYGSKSQHFPGRLEADVERALQELCFTALDITKVDSKPRYLPKTTEHLRKLLALDESLSILEMSNGPMRSEANQYLILQVLKDDPNFANRKFKAGDTVSERYDAFTDFLRRGLKSLALHGMWSELGSSNYEHKTYRGLLALIDYATDPVVAARARMFMDLAMVEIEQISLSGLRGGSKTRAKEGGLLGRFNRTTTMLHGEHHGFILEPPGFKNAYQPPEAATLLRKLGPTEPVYEIINRHVSEVEELELGYIPQYHGVFKLPSRSINYAYRTPEYVIGCAMFDLNHWGEAKRYRKNRVGQVSIVTQPRLMYGTMGRWSGVIFRNRGGVFLEAYTGEKYNVQKKDVMIAQIFKGANYTGEPRVDFASIMEMVEQDVWVFVNNHDAYVAVRVARGGYYWNEPARHRLYLNDAFSPIIIQTGRKAVYGTFEKFQTAILAAPLNLTDDKLDYTGPNSKRIEFWLCKDSDIDPYPQNLPKIDGKELDLNLKHSYQSPYLNGTVGSDVVTVTYGNRRWDYDFGKNTVTEVTR